MSCSRTAVIAVSLMLGVIPQAWSWGQPLEPIHLRSEPTALPSFPLSQDQQWYVKESYLLWHPAEDDTDWSDRIGFNVGFDVDVDISLRMKKPEMGWYSGVRLAAGRYLPNHDHWDVSLTATYFYADAENSSSPKFGKDALLQSAWGANSFSGGFNKGQGNWRLNFFTCDFGLGRNATISSKLTAHPFFALRGAFVDEADTARLSFKDTTTLGLIGNARFKVKGDNTYWGVGPRVGSDFTFYLKNCWTLIGSLSGTVLFGDYSVKEHLRLTATPLQATRRLKATDHGFAVRGNLEGSLGMGWEKWVRRHRVRVAPSIVIEASQWYDMNQWMSFGSMLSIATANAEFNRRHGDLTLWGINLNLQVDF